MWSLGVCVYFLLTGRQPFIGGSPQETANLMGAGKYDASVLARYSDNAKDFIARLLVVDQNRRMSATEALNHPWVRSARQEPDGDVGCCGFIDPWRGKAFAVV